MKQRPNVISCVTVHDSPDSDSSTSSPFPSERLPSFRDASANPAQSRTIIVPSIKTQIGEGLATSAALVSGQCRLLSQSSFRCVVIDGF